MNELSISEIDAVSGASYETVVWGAIGATAGGAIGFLVGGPVGAVVGAVDGAAHAVAIQQAM